MFRLTKKVKIATVIIFGIVCLVFVWEVFVPKSSVDTRTVTHEIKKGAGPEKIANDLEGLGVIKNSFFFRLYVVALGKQRKLQAGTYLLAPSMPVNAIVAKLVAGDVIKNNAVIIEGWNLKEITKYLEDKDYYSVQDFLAETKKDWSEEFVFLQGLPPARAGGAQAGKPQKLNLEGYIFPDTYQVFKNQSAEDFLKTILTNFDKKLTPQLRAEITLQKKSIFEIITMASIIEKEVVSQEDKKIVSGILWKRLKNGMGLNVDSTINYITGKGHASVAIEDTKIDSPYNTYKYRGLPLGPISNPGMNSILAAVYPTTSPYWYYLSADGTGTTIFSKTLEEHNIAVAKYLSN